MTYLENALKDRHARLSGEGNAEKITYVAIDCTERYADPEEKVRAEYWAELIYCYGYKPNCIEFEVKVSDQMSRADIVIFHDDEPRRPYAVIEFKRDGITDSEFDRAVKRVCDYGTSPKFRANFVGVVAGQTRQFLDLSQGDGILEHEANIVADLPQQYGKPEEFRFRKEIDNNIPPANKEVLISTLKKCHQTLWGGGKLLPSEAFDELCKIIFVKIYDEANCKDGEPYEFQTKTYEPNDKLYERICSLHKAQQREETNIFTDNIKIDAPTLRTIVSHIEGINFSKTAPDEKGVAFEVFLGDFFKRQSGQYLTPRVIIDFVVQMMQPQSNERILDPACGSGGFLFRAMNHIRKEMNDHYDNSEKRSEAQQDSTKKRLFGIEVNKEIAHVAKMNMIFHNDDHTNIIITDALEELDRIRERTGNNEFKEQSFDLILTTPPFGAMLSLSENPYLEDYEFWNQMNKAGRKRPRKNQRIEIFFIERIWNFLKPGTGRAAVIIPDGILTNSSLQGVRDFLLKRFQINAVVPLATTAFTQAAIGVSVVFLRRRTDGEKPNDDEAIFMALPELITGNITENQLLEVVRQYRTFEKNPKSLLATALSSEEKPQCFAVRRDKINHRLDPYFYQPRFENLLAILRQGPHEILGNITELCRQKWTPEEHPEDTFRYIEINNVSRDTGEASFFEVPTKEAPRRAQIIVQKDDIIVSLTRPHHGSIALIDDNLDGCIVSTGFAVLREIKDLTLSRLYLHSVLRSQLCLNQMLQRSSGVSYPTITKEQLMQILIPTPSPARQQKFVEQLSRRYAQSRNPREETANEWEDTKVQLEVQLLIGEVL